MLRDLLFRLRSLWRRDAQEHELNDELQFHLDQETAKLCRTGLSEQEARRRARLALGFGQLAQDECRAAHGTRWLEEFIDDLRFGARQLRKNLGFASVAVASLALGIGANTAMFQLLDVLRLRALPVPSPQELYSVVIGSEGKNGNFTSRYSDLSYAQWEQVAQRQSAFSSMGVWSPRSFNLAQGGEVQNAEGMLVSGGFFQTLGIDAWRGRVLGSGDDNGACATQAVVISHAFWQRHFGGAADVVGRRLTLDGHPFTVAGITGPNFFGVEVGRWFDVAAPLCSEDLFAGVDSQRRFLTGNYWLSAIGRLKPGWTQQRANSHLKAISPALFAAAMPKDLESEEQRRRYGSMWLKTESASKGMSHLRTSYQNTLWLLLASAALVLLIACGNLANLLLSRAAVRSQEIRVRLALGASRWRLIRQLMTESLMLAAVGAAMGVFIAKAVNAALLSFLVTADEPVALDTRVDWRVLAFTLSVSLVACVLFGLMPAWRAARSDDAAAPTGTRATTGSHQHSILRQSLVVVQVALSLILVSSAFLFGRSLVNLLRTDSGFQPDHVTVLSLDARRLGYTGEQRHTLFHDILWRVRAIPGVLQAAQSNIVPMSGWWSNMGFRMAGQTVISPSSFVTPGYFEALRIPLLAGRWFNDEDQPGGPTAMIVNQSFVKKFLKGKNPVGLTFPSPLDSKVPCRVVGVAGDTKYGDYKETFGPIMYFSQQQRKADGAVARFLVRTQTEPGAMNAALRDAVVGTSPLIDLELETLREQMDSTLARDKILAALGGGFGILAAVLAAVGLYGLLAYSVESRRMEIGVRMALGADRRAVSKLVTREAAWLVALGSAAGLAATLVLGRWAATLLYGLKAHDPVMLAAAVVALLVIAWFAAAVPARRAASTDPLTALRES